ncbi:hypothetical protein PRZ48_003192 [Zasmidium cellare]|uniref:Uncharacterized protein n=1 Tax=Zasmidium cellare TaxID=395010 RepID=A0ABR0EUZ3_ZASCE|nr:hypothetical protein PRZ48_003192 [Zasmidium cellare]
MPSSDESGQRSSPSAADDFAESTDLSNSSDFGDSIKTGAVEESPYPGFDLWNANSELKKATLQTPTFVSAQDEYVQSVDIRHPDAFKLKTLTISEGPLKGRHVIMLEPVTDHFRFLALPAEIRNLIYEFLFQTSCRVAIRKVRSRYVPARPAYSVLRVNRQVQAEAAPVGYGKPQFSFNCLSDLKNFLDDIGSMSQFLGHIGFHHHFYHRTVATSTFHRLKDAKRLRSLTFLHLTVCEQARSDHKLTTASQLAADLRPLFKVLQRAQKSSDSPINVLDILKLGEEAYRTICKDGKDGKDCDCGKGWYNCPTKCQFKEKHIEEAQARVRKALAKELGLEDASS